MNKAMRSITRIINATRWSIQGLKKTFQTEEAFRQEVLLFIVLAPLGYWLGDNGIERSLLISSVLFVLVVELINSAIESVVDRISMEQHTLSGKAKDQGSAAVFVALLIASATWVLILVDKA